MSMVTDKFFYLALKESDVETMTGERIYNTARPERDEEEDRLPYVIVTLDSVTNDPSTKDGGEGDYDTVTVSVLCVAETRGNLATLVSAVRMAVMNATYAAEEDITEEMLALRPLSYLFTADGVQYDPTKPCFYQTMHYQCDTER